MSLDILGAINAPGLSDADKEIFEMLIGINSKMAMRNAQKVAYYEGDVQPENIGISVLPPSVRLVEHCDWPRKAVTSVSERSRFSGFVFENGKSEPALDEVVRDNSLIGAYNRHVHSELIHGCMFATVGQNNGKCIVRFHTAETSGAMWDDYTGCIAAGFVIAKTELTRWSPNYPVPTQVNLHMPGRVLLFRRLNITDWTLETLNTGIERPLMEAFCYRPTALKPFGQSRIDKTVMSITDNVIRTLQNMTISSALYSSPQKYLLGLSEEQFDSLEKNKWLAYITHVLMTTTDEEGNSPEFGQLSPSSPEPYISVLRTYATLFSAATGVPINSLGIVQDNPSSAEAIDAAREDICICTQDLNESNGESLRNIALLAMACAHDTSIDGLNDNQRSVMAKFLDPSMPSVVSQADAAVKIASAAPWFADSDEFLRMLGMDEATIRQLAATKTLASTQKLMQAFASNAQNSQTPVNENAEPVEDAE